MSLLLISIFFLTSFFSKISSFLSFSSIILSIFSCKSDISSAGIITNSSSSLLSLLLIISLSLFKLFFIILSLLSFDSKYLITSKYFPCFIKSWIKASFFSSSSSNSFWIFISSNISLLRFEFCSKLSIFGLISGFSSILIFDLK